MASPAIPQAEINDLAPLLEQRSEFQGTPQDKAQFITSADLGRFVPGLNLHGSTATVVGTFLNKLNTYGSLPDAPTYHALGQLLAYMLTLKDYGLEDLTLIARLIVQYGLVRDQTYLADLKSAYDLEVASPSPQGRQWAPPPPQGLFPLAPSFESQIEDPVVLERVLNSESNFLDLHVLIGAFYSAQAVGRIEMPEGEPIGTGFLVGPDMLLTNQHVLTSDKLLNDAVVRFGYVSDPLGANSLGEVVRFVSDFYYASPKDALDYALVKLQRAPLPASKNRGELRDKSLLTFVRENKHRGYLLMAPVEIGSTSRVNIIQHPKGMPLKVVLTQNYVAAPMTDTRVHYLADTDDGSSGSPVFNSRWEVVALHHGHRETKLQRRDGTRITYENEGIPMKAIVADLKRKDLLAYIPDLSG